MEKNVRVTLHLPPETATGIKALTAIQESASMGKIIADAFAQYLSPLPADVRKHVDAAVRLAQKKD